MSVCPKHAWGGVKAMLHSVFDQIDTAAVHTQYDKLLDQVGQTLPQVHVHLDDARAEILAFTAFPKDVWRQIWSNCKDLRRAVRTRFLARGLTGVVASGLIAGPRSGRVLAAVGPADVSR